MANLNQHDIVFLDSPDFTGFRSELERKYNFRILSTSLPPIVSFTSKKIILDTSSGTFFLKEKPKYCSDYLMLMKSAHFQEYLATQIGIVPKIAMTIGHEYYVIWDDRHYFLTEYKPGRHYNGSSTDIEAMVDALHIFQQSGRAYVAQYRDSRDDELVPFESYVVASGIPGLKSFIKSQTEARIFNDILQAYNDLQVEYSRISRGERVMSHSDFILFNLVLNDSGVIAINDFDNVKVLPRIHDMAEFLVSASLLNYIAPLTNLKLPVSTNPEARVFDRILDLYRTRFDLSGDEWKLLGVVAEVVWLWTLVLAVFKGDYSLTDLSPVLPVLHEKKIQSRIIRQIGHQFAIS